LCGGLNVNLLRVLVQDMRKWKDQGVDNELALIGNKGAAFFRSFGGNVVATLNDVGEEPSLEDLIGSVKVMLDAFEEGRIDRLYIASNEFVNTMTQQPTVAQLLPLEAADDDVRAPLGLHL
jgi:F-type H+-transporting ATPase subunit gamma